MRRVCVYCGSRVGEREVFAAAAQRLGKAIAARGFDLVYGGAAVGLMGIVADTVLEHGREVHGVIPHALFDREVAHRGVTELHEVETMHERKAKMAELADAFIALPGGFGTLEEIFEVLTWTQLGIHAKPCGLLDVDGYFGALQEFLDRTVQEGFVAPKNRAHLVVESDADALLTALEERVDAGGLAVPWTAAHRRDRQGEVGGTD
ncbi:MAG: TIGR00730 family Rossman fold protein [Planctomycetota bacterium]